MYMKEIWKNIPGYSGYKASNTGLIKSLSRYVTHPRGGQRLVNERVMKNQKGTNGYFIVGISKNGKVTSKTVHRLIALSFISNPNNKKEVNHKDGNKKNNFVSNLEWTSVSENRQHAFDLGLQKGSTHLKGKTGAKCMNSKPVFKLLSDGNKMRYVSTTSAQEKTGIDRSMISKCAKGKMRMAGGFKWKYA